jgi:hypothetical protein
MTADDRLEDLLDHGDQLRSEEGEGPSGSSLKRFD